MPSDAAVAEITEDAVLGGRLRLRQPKRGHRVGHDAILLAAACGGVAGDHVVEFGAGVGAAGLALAARCPGPTVTLAEIDRALAALAADNTRLNALDGRVRALCCDVTERNAFAAAGIGDGCVRRVLMNPPFNDPSRQALSPDPRRRLAHAAAAHVLPLWVDAAARLLAADGVLTLIWRADGLAAVLEALARDFGGIAVLPVYPRAGEPAIRILVRAVKAGRAPLMLYPGLTLNDADGRPSAAAEAVLRHGQALPFAAL